MRSLMMLMLLAACASAGVAEDRQDRAAAHVAGRVAGEPRGCISPMQGQGLIIVDSRTLSYRSGKTIWLNRMERECPGMTPHSTLIIEADGGQYCRGDRVRALEPGRSIPGPVCILGDFTPYRERR
jgi:hypothetical protein